MRNFLLICSAFLFLSLSLFSCEEAQEAAQETTTWAERRESLDDNSTTGITSGSSSSSNQNAEEMPEYNMQFSTATTIPGTEWLVVPVGWKSDINNKKYARSGKNAINNETINYLFYNANLNEQHFVAPIKKRYFSKMQFLFQQESAKINDFGEPSPKSIYPYIIFEGKEFDINGDDKLNYIDPSFLYISDINGNFFRKISPGNEHVRFFQFSPESQTLLMFTQDDSNENKKVDNTDREHLYAVTLSKVDSLRAVVHPANADSLHQAFIEPFVDTTN